MKRHAVKLHRPVDPTIWVILAYFSIFILLFKMSPIILGALTLGWYLSMIIEVPARTIAKIKFIPYKVAIVISSILMFAILAVSISLLIPLLIDQGKMFINLLVTGVTNLDLPKLFNIKNERVREEIVKATDSLISTLSVQATTLGGNAINWTVQQVPGATTAILIFVITASYFTALVPLISGNLWRFFPRTGRRKAITFMAAFYGDLRHFIGGQVIIALFVGLLMGIGMAIAGIPNALFLGFLAGITNFIPFLGVIIAGIPALLVGLTHAGLWGLAKVGIVIIITNQFESWVLAPRIQGKRMRLNWFLIIIAIFFFAQVLGVAGVLLAIPMLIFFRNFWTQYIQKTFDRI